MFSLLKAFAHYTFPRMRDPASADRVAKEALRRGLSAADWVGGSGQREVQFDEGMYRDAVKAIKRSKGSESRPEGKRLTRLQRVRVRREQRNRPSTV